MGIQVKEAPVVHSNVSESQSEIDRWHDQLKASCDRLKQHQQESQKLLAKLDSIRAEALAIRKQLRENGQQVDVLKAQVRDRQKTIVDEVANLADQLKRYHQLRDDKLEKMTSYFSLVSDYFTLLRQCETVRFRIVNVEEEYGLTLAKFRLYQFFDKELGLLPSRLRSGQLQKKQEQRAFCYYIRTNAAKAVAGVQAQRISYAALKIAMAEQMREKCSRLFSDETKSTGRVERWFQERHLLQLELLCARSQSQMVQRAAFSATMDTLLTDVQLTRCRADVLCSRVAFNKIQPEQQDEAADAARPNDNYDTISNDSLAFTRQGAIRRRKSQAQSLTPVVSEVASDRLQQTASNHEQQLFSVSEVDESLSSSTDKTVVTMPKKQSPTLAPADQRRQLAKWPRHWFNDFKLRFKRPFNGAHRRNHNSATPQTLLRLQLHVQLRPNDHDKDSGR